MKLPYWHVFILLFQISDCKVLDTQISREDGGIDTVTQLIMGTTDKDDPQYLSSVSQTYGVFYFTKILSTREP